MTFAIAFLLGSMFGACAGFLTGGVMRAVRSGDDAGETALAERTYFAGLSGDAPMQIDHGVPLAPWPVEPV
jgi:hypothetical protein